MLTRFSNPAISLTSLLFQRSIALAVLALTAYCVVDYPFARVWLSVLLIVYGVSLLFLPHLWLLVLPIVLPLLNLAPWSGRFYLEEFDFFIWVSLASAFWHGSYSLGMRPRFAATPWLLIAFLVTTHGIATIRGLLPMAAVDVNAFNSYFSHFNALRISKSLVWAVLLIPPVQWAFTADLDRARRLLGYGIVIGLIGTGISVLWERGVLGDLIYGENIYAKFQSLTDFSSDYRITALFSEMHTGGEAVDGYIALTWPFALGLLISARSRWEIGLGGIALSAGLYSALVTFSRGTYLAVGVSLFTFALISAIRKMRQAASGESVKLAWPLPVILVGMAGVCMLLYEKGGHYALIAALGIFSGSVLLNFFKYFRRNIRTILMVFLLLAGFALMLRGLVTSKWVSNGIAESLAISLPVSLGLLVCRK